MNKPTADHTAPPSKSLYSAQQHQHQKSQPTTAAMATPVSEDERIARALQDQYNRENGVGGPPVLAQPGFQPPMDLPFNCGHCGMAHLVRHVTPNTSFQCTRCGRENQIAIQSNRPVVVMQRRSWVPIPIFCSIQ